MKCAKRGFGGHHELIVVFAVIGIVLAIMIPIFARAFQHANRHGASLSSALVQATGMVITTLITVFVLLPLVPALLCACLARLTGKRTERFRELLLEYWGASLIVEFVMMWLAGLCLLIWQHILVPAIHHLRH
jgi:hypothetical protein